MTPRSLFLCLLLLSFGLSGGCSQKDGHIKAGRQQQAVVILSLADIASPSTQAFKAAFTRAAPRFGFTAPGRQAEYKTLYLRGYFSVVADEDDNDSNLFYVFDILNRSGQRLHRARGLYPLPSTGAEQSQPFRNRIKPEGYTAIANDVLRQIRIWANRQ